ncbi:MAG: hypothetical protein QXX36_03645 [Candidatus Rehaiarchaeum fermentans]|nr:hypothetical protein [Candidatus Rehaiarchaeum fermentans]
MKRLATITHNKLIFVLTTSILSSAIMTILIYNKGYIYSIGDVVYPLSSNVFYNYNLFFTNINGGSPVITNYPPLRNIIALILLLPFFNQYSEIVAFFIDTFIGNIAISLLVYKSIERQENIKMNLYIYFVTILSESILYTGVMLYYTIALYSGAFFPIFASFPWVIYFIDSVINDNEKFFIKVIKIVIAEIIIILFITTFPNIILVGYSMVIILFLSYLFLSKIVLKQKLKIFTVASILFVLFNVIYLGLYVSWLNTNIHPSSSGVSLGYVYILEDYYSHFSGIVGSALTLSYYGNVILAHNNPILVVMLVLNAILVVIPFIIKRKIKYAIPPFISFLFLSGWFAAPYFNFYLTLYAKIPYLWSLDFPYLSFPYFVTLSFSLALGIGLSHLNFRKIILKIIIILLLMVSIFANFYIAYTGYYPGSAISYPPRQSIQTYFPDYLYKISSIIDSSNIYNPRILVFPLSPLYVAYNFSNTVYTGVGFWYTLLKGDVYSSYYSPGATLEWFINIYPALNLTDIAPVLNAMKILGINYVVVTRNIIPPYYYGLYNQAKIQNFEEYLKDYPVLFNNSDMSLYYFSNEQVVSPVKYIILVNISEIHKLSLLREALTISFVNYSSAIIFPKSNENYLLKYLNGEDINITNINENITVITINNINVKSVVYGNAPNEFTIKISTEPTQNYTYIPLIVRYNYFPIYNNSYSGNYSDLVIIPAYATETYLLLVKPSSPFAIINFNYTIHNIAYYTIIVYPSLIIILTIYLILRNRLGMLIKTISSNLNNFRKRSLK